MKRLLLSWFSAESLETIGLWLIIGGLIGEAALVFSILETSFEKPLTFVFTLAIAAGVWIEFIGSSDISSEKDARIAEANARALEAQLALEKYRAPRHLSDEQWADVLAKIRLFGPQPFDIAANNADPEAQRMANAILFNLWSMAGWTPISWKGRSGEAVTRWSMPNFPDWGINNMVIGVDIQIVPKEREMLEPVARTLAEALAASGIEARLDISGTHSANVNTIHILVGPKR